MRICLYCFHTFVILEFLTIQVLSTLSLVVMTSNNVETTRVVETCGDLESIAVGTIVLVQCGDIFCSVFIHDLIWSLINSPFLCSVLAIISPAYA
jgi:hypothetical protein